VKPATVPDAERLARAALARVVEPGDAQVGALVRKAGAEAAWDAVRTRDPSAGAAVLALSRARVEAARPAEDLDVVTNLGGRLVCPGDAEWPPALDELEDLRPLALWVVGPLELREACARAVGIVGARAATRYGEQVAGEWAARLAEGGRVVLSGAAYGIDGAAHRGALAVSGGTVAVLACGVDIAYPRGHDGLLTQIRRTGAVVSEWPPGCAPMRHRFLTRNRVIAAATTATVVVEAAARSGALNTARSALALDRPVLIVPGPVTSAMSVGSNGLLRTEGVRAVGSVADVVEEVGRLGVDLAPALRGPNTARDALTAVVSRVLDAVPVRTPRGPASIAQAAGVEVGVVLRCLGPLELQGLVERQGAGYRLTKLDRPTAS
jgi:DNA processing protein